MEIALLERILARHQHRSTDESSEVRRCSVDTYLSPQRFDQEWRHIFERYPLAVGDASEVARPGQYVTRRVRDVPIVIVRDHEGALRAFKNVCRHRGATLLASSAGTIDRCITCPYHGWSYTLDGALHNAPHARGFDAETLEQARLVELPIEECLGYLWIGLTPQTPLDMIAYLGGFHVELGAATAGLPVVINRVHSTRAMNWKLWIETGLETYHVGSLHRDSVGPYAIANRGLVDQEHRHLRVLFPKRKLDDVPGMPKESWRLLDVANLFYFVFPNTMLLVEHDRVTRITAMPVEVDRFEYDQSCRVAAVPADEKQSRRTDRASELINRVFEEDLQIAQAIQDNLRSGANEYVTFGTHEYGLALFHDALTSALQASA